ncbi:MAG: tyrosine-protein phosphatase, partial [Anaerovoracaceae bacterium]
TNDRADYDSDQIFANFRNIAAGDLGKNTLFRSSSPINNDLGRAAYADDFVESNGIQTVMNLANSDTDITGYMAQEDFDSPYYASLYQAGKVKALNLSLDFAAEDFQDGLAEGLHFFTANEGPYLVHCDEGKDRAGFVSALLACYMGASYDQVVEDYMQTYINYYHLEKGSEQYIAVKNSNIDSTLRMITGSSDNTDLAKVDLAAAAKRYMKSIGLSDAECEALHSNLAKDYEKVD